MQCDDKNQKPWIIVGLGNPGQKYKNTRHNLGIEMISRYAKRQGIKFSKRRKLYSLGEFKAKENEIFLVKPRTFVNNSGMAVKNAIQSFRGSLSQTLIICDDINLPFGKIRLRKKGDCGGHNGLKSITKEVLSNEYPRLRIGIGLTENRDPANFVLGKFKEKELIELGFLFNKIKELIDFIFVEGIDQGMNKFN